MITTHQTRVIDSTGEVISHQEYHDGGELIFCSKQKWFTKKMYGHTPRFSTPSYLGYFHMLPDYLEQNTNRLVMNRRGNWLTHVPMTDKDLMEILSISPMTLWRFLKECRSKGYLRAHQIDNLPKGYYMSPLYFQNGSGFSVELYLIFQGVPEIEAALTVADKDRIGAYLGCMRRS